MCFSVTVKRRSGYGACRRKKRKNFLIKILGRVLRHFFEKQKFVMVTESDPPPEITWSRELGRSHRNSSIRLSDVYVWVCASVDGRRGATFLTLYELTGSMCIRKNRLLQREITWCCLGESFVKLSKLPEVKNFGYMNALRIFPLTAKDDLVRQILTMWIQMSKKILCYFYILT